MGRRRRSEGRRGESTEFKLIGGGLLLLVLPFFLPSLVALGVRPFRPLGWLLVVIGCGLLWWKARGRSLMDAAAQPAKPAARPSPGSTGAATSAADDVSYRSMSADAMLDALAKAGPKPRGPVVSNAPMPTATPACPRAWSAQLFGVIEWRRFEALVEALFAQAGFQTKSQTHGADGGIDIWLHSKSMDGAPVSIVQCKHWTGKPVGVDKIRELRGVMAAHGISRGQFATTSTFTADAISFGKANGVNLLDVNELLKVIATRTPEQQQALLDVALEGEYWRPTCASCGVKLVERTPRSGKAAFWGCRNYPRCRNTMQMRRAAAAAQ